MEDKAIALQLYTVRDLLQSDFPGTLENVAQIGYRAVELAGTGGLSAGELKRILDDNGLEVAGSHIGIEALEADLSAVLDYNEAIGNRFIVCPYLPAERRKTADDWRRVGAFFNEVGARCRDRGFVFAYHNHSFEFEPVDGRPGMAILLDAVDPGLVKLELDLYWVRHGGEDPAGYLRRLGRQVALVHLKDMADDAEGSFAEVGEGVLDWRAIFEACPETDAAWYIVEQDVCRRPTLESIRISLENLKRMGIAG